jgi:hypothetical protein
MQVTPSIICRSYCMRMKTCYKVFVANTAAELAGGRVPQHTHAIETRQTAHLRLSIKLGGHRRTPERGVPRVRHLVFDE